MSLAEAYFFKSWEIHVFRDFVVGGFIASEGLSILEHLVVGGIWIPEPLLKLLEVIREKNVKEMKDKVDGLTNKQKEEMEQLMKEYIENLERKGTYGKHDTENGVEENENQGNNNRNN